MSKWLRDDQCLPMLSVCLRWNAWGRSLCGKLDFRILEPLSSWHVINFTAYTHPPIYSQSTDIFYSIFYFILPSVIWRLRQLVNWTRWNRWEMLVWFEQWPRLRNRRSNWKQPAHAYMHKILWKMRKQRWVRKRMLQRGWKMYDHTVRFPGQRHCPFWEILGGELESVTTNVIDLQSNVKQVKICFA